DLIPGPASASPTTFTAYNGALYFLVKGELWRTDGTPAGTVRLPDLAPAFPPAITSLTADNGPLDFLSPTSPTKHRLYQFDGDSAHANFFVDAGRLYFTARAGSRRVLFVITGPGATPIDVVDLGAADQTNATVTYVRFRDALHFAAAGKLFKLATPTTAQLLE